MWGFALLLARACCWKNSRATGDWKHHGAHLASLLKQRHFDITIDYVSSERVWRFHWFRWWLVACSVLSYYLNQLKDRWFEMSWRPCCITVITMVRSAISVLLMITSSMRVRRFALLLARTSYWKKPRASWFVQIAKCADNRARTMGHAGSEYVFCLQCSYCCVYFSVLELLQPVTPENPLSWPHWPSSGAFGLPQPGDQMTLVWPSFSWTQICNFLDSIK